MYIDRPLKEYLDDLAARKPTPGGGSVSALTAVTGTSLMSMVANFTIGRPEYKDVENKVKGILLETKRFDSDLRVQIDADVEAYKKLTAAIKGSLGDSDEMDRLYKDAAMPPRMVCEIAGKCMRLCLALAECGNKKLITDTAIAAILFEAAFFSAKFNVYINLKNVKDTDYIADVHLALTKIEEEMPRLKDEILEICEDVISS